MKRQNLVFVLISLLLGVVSSCGTTATRAPRGGTADTQSLYQRLGGVDVLRLLVDQWLLEVSSDAHIGQYFSHANISQLKLRLVERLCVRVGGPCLYRGRDMYEVHADLRLEDSHLRAFIQALEPAMRRANIEKAEADELREVIHALAQEVAVALMR